MERSETMQFLASRQAPKDKPRSAGLGGGDIAGICGLDGKWNSPFMVFGKKVGAIDDEVGESAKWGLLAEPMMRQEFARVHNVLLINPGFLEDPDNPIFHGHPDDVEETKTEVYDWKFLTEYGSRQFEKREEWDEHEDDSHLVRKKDLVQLHWYAPLLDVKKARLVVLPSNHQLDEYHIEINPDLVEALRYRGAKFWQDHVLKEEPPDPGASERDNEMLKKMFPKEDTSDLVEPDEQQLVTIENYQAALEQSWEAKKKADALAHLLKLMIGKDKGGFLLPDGKKLTWKTAKDSRGVNWEELARSLVAGGEIPEKLMKKHIGVTKKGGRRFVSPRTWKSAWEKGGE
jgi:predicted phage-related endonuclease